MFRCSVYHQLVGWSGGSRTYFLEKSYNFMIRGESSKFFVSECFETYHPGTTKMFKKFPIKNVQFWVPPAGDRPNIETFLNSVHHSKKLSWRNQFCIFSRSEILWSGTGMKHAKTSRTMKLWVFSTNQEILRHLKKNYLEPPDHLTSL